MTSSRRVKWGLALLCLILAAAILAYVILTTTGSSLIAAAVFISIVLLILPLYASVSSLGAMLGKIGTANRKIAKEQQVVSSQITNSNRNIEKGHASAKAVIKEIGGLQEGVSELQGQVHQISRQTGSASVQSKVVAPVQHSVSAPLIPSATPAREPRALDPNRTTKVHKPKPIAADEFQHWTLSRQAGESYRADGFGWERSGPPLAREVSVAMIADDFTFNSFKNEFATVRLHPGRWRSQMEAAQPSMFVCESAWQGGSPTTRPWQAKIYASVRWPKENRTVLLEILEYCHAKGIPTVFWNKEDPAHFDDRINDFVRTAVLFDYIFTTAEECVESYRTQAGALNVDSLKFAVQPSIFHPVGRDTAADKAVFAGTWYGNYKQRCQVAEIMLDAVIASGRDVDIYNRMFDSTDPRHKYPSKYDQFIKPPIPFSKTADAYREATFGLTLNTVVDSRTMFARRAYEISAAGGVVLSNTALGIKDQFGDKVIYLDEHPGALIDLSQKEYRDYQYGGLSVSVKNTYTHRAQELLHAVGVEHEDVTGRADIIAVPRTDQELHAYLSAWQNRPNTMDHLVLILDESMFRGSIESWSRVSSSDVTTISMRSIREGLRPQSFLRNPSSVVLGRPENIGLIDVEYVTGCLQFPEKILHLAESSDLRYRRNVVNDPGGCVVESMDLQNLLTASFPLPVFEI